MKTSEIVIGQKYAYSTRRDARWAREATVTGITRQGVLIEYLDWYGHRTETFTRRETVRPQSIHALWEDFEKDRETKAIADKAAAIAREEYRNRKAAELQAVRELMQGTGVYVENYTLSGRYTLTLSAAQLETLAAALKAGN